MKALEISLLSSAVAFIAAATIIAINSNGKFECPPKHVCINPDNVTCFVFDMGVDRWKPVRDRNHRQKISVDVYYGKAEYKRQMQGVDCYEIDQHFMLGDKVVATLPVDWWRQR